MSRVLTAKILPVIRNTEPQSTASSGNSSICPWNTWKSRQHTPCIIARAIEVFTCHTQLSRLRCMTKKKKKNDLTCGKTTDTASWWGVFIFILVCDTEHSRQMSYFMILAPIPQASSTLLSVVSRLVLSRVASRRPKDKPKTLWKKWNLKFFEFWYDFYIETTYRNFSK